jgi:hypothetical protein
MLVWGNDGEEGTNQINFPMCVQTRAECAAAHLAVASCS